MPELQTHPTYEELEAFSLGRIAPPTATEIEEHVAHCDKCCETLLGFDANDTFVGLLVEADRIPDGSTINLHERDSNQSERPEFRDMDVGDDVPTGLTQHSRYHVVGLIGSGGMGDVYKAEHRMMQRTVALKVINRRLIDRPEAVERFHREVRAAARLHHPNIVAAYDAEQAGGIHFLAMEYVDGTELSQIVKDRGPLPVDAAVDYTLQTLAGLEHAHEMGMVHRDIKPHNLMLDASGNIKILDFGLAHFASESAAGAESEAIDSADGSQSQRQLTQLGTMMGTPDYVAPEQAIDARSADIRSDIYSLGCTLYFLLTGRAPFAEDLGVEKLRAHTERNPESVMIIRHDIQPALDEVLRRMMAKDPAERYQTPSEAATALRQFAKAAVAEGDGEPLTDSSGEGSIFKKWLIAGAFLPFVAAAGVMLYLATDTGRIEITSDAAIPGAKVVLAKGGKEYATFDIEPGAKTQKIRAGEYDVSLRGTSQGVGMSVWTKPDRSNDWGEPDDHESEPVVLYRGGGLLIDVSKRTVTKASNRRVAAQPSRSGLPTAKLPPPAKLDAVRTLAGHEYGHHVSSLAIPRSGGVLLSGSSDGSARLWELESRRVLDVFRGLKAGNQTSVAISSDGGLVAVADWDGRVRLWSRRDNGKFEEEPERDFLAHEGGVYQVAFFTDDETLLTSGCDNTARVWSAANGELKAVLRGHTGWVSDVAVSPNEARAVTTSFDETVRLWDVATGRELRQLSAARGIAFAVAFSPDSEEVAAGFRDGSVRVFDAESGIEVLRLSGHTDRVQDVCFLPDGKHVASGSYDCTLRVWSLETGREVARTTNEKRIFNTLAVTPDGRSIAAAGGIWKPVEESNDWQLEYDNTIRIWGLPENLPSSAAVSPVRQAMREKLAAFLLAGKQNLSDEQLKSLLSEHTPVLAEFDLDAGRELASLLTDLPGAAHEKLLEEGYLKWSFKSLDVGRQASLQTFMKHLLAPAEEMGFPAGTAEMGPTLLERADVGFTIVSPPDSDGQVLFWYMLPADAPMPVSFPVLVVNVDPNEREIMGERWLIEELFRLSDRPDSETPPAAPGR